MAYTVWGAFEAFRKTVVDLDAEETRIARRSRDFLTGQLDKLSQTDSSFPSLQGRYMPYGSFARHTKIRPLDDIDVLVLLTCAGTSVKQSPNDPHTWWLRLESSASSLAAFPDGFGFVNSTKILNKISSSLDKVSQYSRADIKKNMQAVTLSLVSYSWSFDLVPAVPVSDGNGGTAYYLIPNGRGDWLRTDPRIDDNNIQTRNRQHSGNFLATMRLLKYWNSRVHKPRLPSYYFETLVLQVFAYSPTIVSLPDAVKYFFDNCPSYLWRQCPDPKGLGPALDQQVDAGTKLKVSTALSEAATLAGYALSNERLANYKCAIDYWGRVFGPNFPAYG